MSMTASQYDKVVFITDSVVITWEIWKQMLDKEQSNNFKKKINHKCKIFNLHYSTNITLNTH